MDLNQVFLIVGLGALVGGLGRSVISLASASARGDKIAIGEAIGTVVRDIVIGGFAAFLLWLFSSLMNTPQGEILTAIVAGLVGAQALALVIQSSGFKNERDLFAQAMADENTIDESGIIGEVERLKQEAEAKDRRILELEKQLSIGQTVEQLEALESRIDRLEDTVQDDDDSDDDDEKRASDERTS